MVIHWKYIFIISIIIYSKSSLYSTSSVHTITDGNLSSSWLFNFTIFANESKGVILYCIDSGNNQLGLTVIQESNNKRSLRIKFNKAQKSVSLKQLCGCDPCHNEAMTFIIRLIMTMVHCSCNNINGSESFTSQSDIIKQSDENNNNGLYPIPKIISNTTNKLYIMMGNIEPYDSVDNTMIYPAKEHFIGCIDSFYYNDKGISFLTNGIKVRPTCPNPCNNNYCNGGLCRRMTAYNVTCDCSTVALNGPYCNNSLKMYVPGANNTFILTNETSQISLKMTWKPMLYKPYCLMSIDNEYGHVTLSINNDNLMINSTVISDIKKEGINFITVIIANNSLLFKTNNNNVTSHIKGVISLDNNTTIKVGFSDNNNNDSCHTFEGAFDVLFDSSVRAIIRRPSTVTTNKTRTSTRSYGIQRAGSILVSLAVIGCIAIFGGFIIILYLIYKKSILEIKKAKKIILPTEAPRGKLTDPNIYGKVCDNSIYDSIPEQNGYAVIEL